MVLDNSKYFHMAKSFPRDFKFNQNKVVKAGVLGMTTNVVFIGMGLCGYFFWANLKINYPYMYSKVIIKIMNNKNSKEQSIKLNQTTLQRM
jgi:hypothetical protein